jgi:hypothetical protein
MGNAADGGAMNGIGGGGAAGSPEGEAGGGPGGGSAGTSGPARRLDRISGVTSSPGVRPIGMNGVWMLYPPSIPEGDGTMLDNTLIYWGVESGTDHNHSPRDMQYLLIGGKNMGFKTGQFLKNPSTESAHKLHTSVLRGLGYTAATAIGIEPMSGPLMPDRLSTGRSECERDALAGA